jgi:hypothetical protein
MRARPKCARGWFVEGCSASRTLGTVTPARRPRFLPIIITGAVIGFLVGASLAVFGWFEDRDTMLESNYGVGGSGTCHAETDASPTTCFPVRRARRTPAGSSGSGPR